MTPLSPYAPLAAAAAASQRSGALTALIIAIFSILGIAVLLFVMLVVLRLIGSARERRFERKKELLRPMVYDLLTEDMSPEDIARSLNSVVPARDRGALEQVMLENVRFLKGGEQDTLTIAFDLAGFVDEDIAGLRSLDSVRKAQAAFHLGQMRAARAAPALIDALESARQPEVVFSCLNALSKIGTPEALEAVIDHLASAPELETLRVAEVILERKQEFSGYLEDWLGRVEGDTSRVILLVNLMGAMKDARSVPLLDGFLSHQDPAVRAGAAASLGNIGDFTVCSELIGAMDDDDAGVRAAAAESLGKLQCDEAIPRLERGLADEDLEVKMNCAVALSQLGEEGRSVLERTLLTTEEVSRELAAEALQTIEVKGPEGTEGR